MDRKADEAEGTNDFGTDIGEKSRKTPVALVVQGTKIWVSPQELAGKSDYFDRIFFGPYKEKDEEIIPLKKIKLDCFLPFLNCIREPFAWNEVHRNYPEILEMADFFGMDSLLGTIKEYLISQILPQLNIFLESDKFEMIRMLNCTFEVEKGTKSDFYKETFKRVLSMDAKFISGNKKNLLDTPYADLIRAKMRGHSKHFSFANQHRLLSSEGSSEECDTCHRNSNPRTNNCCICGLIEPH